MLYGVQSDNLNLSSAETARKGIKMCQLSDEQLE